MSSYLLNLTRYNEIGANCYYLNLDGKGVVLDSGMHPKLDGYAALPDFKMLDSRKVEAAFITHAHHDHIGSLPLLMHYVQDARIFMSEPTYFLGDPLLHNSVNVMKKQREDTNIPEYPLYTHTDINKAISHWQAVHINKRWSLEGFPSNEQEDVSFEFHHAGHILGSVAVELNQRGRRILYTGDVNFRDQTILSAARFPKQGIDTLITECTRGSHHTPDGYSRKGVVDNLIRAINETFDKGGAVMIPIFAMGKTQELLMVLHEARENGDLPEDTPIFIGGLSRVFTHVYDSHGHYPDITQPDLEIMQDVRPEVLDGRIVSHLKPKKGQIFLISSGMMTEKTLSNILAQQFLPRENCSIFFVGYCDPDSPAGRLRSTPRGQRVLLNKNSGEYPVQCRVEYFDMTAHANREDILAYIQELNPRKCILVHGDAPALEWMKDQLSASHPSMQIVIPEPGKEVDLD